LLTLGHWKEQTKQQKKIEDIDILINNVGIYFEKNFFELTDEEWINIFEVNVLSGVRMSRAYLPKLLKKGWGRIVFVSSESALNIPTEMIHYGVSKTAQVAVANGLARLTAGTAVTVNSILPGPTSSEGVKNLLSQMAQQRNVSLEEIEKIFFNDLRPNSLLRRFITEEEIANLVLYLASPGSAATNGAAFRCEGGLLNTFF